MKENHKSQSGIFFACTEAQKRQIKAIAAKCGLGQGEYILQRALGYEPKSVPPDAIFVFHEKLCEILEAPPTPETEKAALRIFDEIYNQLIDNRKQTPEEISAEMKGGVVVSLPSDSGP